MNLGFMWKTNWFISIMLTFLFVVAIQQENSPLNSLENSTYDAIATHSIAVDKRIVLITIDQKSLLQSKITPQQALTSTITTLAQSEASFISITSMSLLAVDKPPSKSLIQTIRQSGNILLPMYFTIHPTPSTNLSSTTRPQLKNLALQHIHPTQSAGDIITAKQASLPNASIISAAAGIGHVNIIPDNDGITRHETLAIDFKSSYFPSLALILAASVLDTSLQDIRINMGENIEMGSLRIPTDNNAQLLPFLPQNKHPTTFQSYTFDQLQQGKIPLEGFKNKIVLIGTNDQQNSNNISTPNSSMSSTEFIAYTLQSILHHHSNQRPSWTQSIEIVLLITIGLYLIFLLPRLERRLGMIISGITFIALISIDLALLQYQSLWLQTIGAALLLLTGHIAFTGKQLFLSTQSHRKPTSDVYKTNKNLGLSFQNQGMLDQAFEKFMSCPINDAMLSTFYSLAQAFERKQQFEQATAVYQHIASHEADYQDIQKRIQSTQKSTEIASIEDPNTALSNLLISGSTSPTLGRYEIINELGKGAMGTVFLGKDPKINRKVAIKTMALSQEFEPTELDEVKAKFFHEAEIAGMLNHPNIVTIFDAGDEQDLAYIAMEFLDGVDLSGYTKKGKLLPFATTLKIVAKVAEALQYAHEHGVIHRDIKPANIMILKNKTVKVTDFGIAHIIDTSKTKAGVVLGTPSYMSPEQLSGKKLDGRSDLFSLGVMLYELSCGTRPFKADSIAKLMYKIAKQPHLNICEHNPDVPDCIGLLIDELLTKKAAQRIGNARDVIKKIALCLNTVKHGESQ